MVQIGYALSSEEHGPLQLVAHARAAEARGFDFAVISDHVHPWIDRQGESSFVWSVLGAIAAQTNCIPVGTGVTCPTGRTGPLVVAHAAATVARLMPGRFFLGLGTGENLNEHVTGARWPAADERVEMLDEAIDVIQALLTGDMVTHRGRYFSVDHAKLYTIPQARPPIYVAAKKTRAAELAGRQGDGLINTSPDRHTVREFLAASGPASAAKPRIGQLTVCVAKTEHVARRTAVAWWPTAALVGDLTQELALPQHFTDAAAWVGEDDVAASIVCGPDPKEHITAIDQYVKAGYTHVYVHQVGPDQEAMFDLYEREVLPHYRSASNGEELSRGLAPRAAWA
jgi:G6PDH family F420-dependent oxidoreductase